MKNHSKEEQEQVRAGRDTDTSQEGWLDYDYSLAQYDSQGFRRHQEVTHVRRGNYSYQATLEIEANL